MFLFSTFYPFSLSRELGITLLVKAEFCNPGGSVKDRVALKMVEIASSTGKLKTGGTVFEGTSGSTGISLAMVCNSLGYKCVIYLPDDVALEKINTLKAVGAEVRLCKAVSVVDESHMCRAAEKAANEADPNNEGYAFYTDQFENPANFLAHLHGTGPEIVRQAKAYGKVNVFVSGAGTGGTIAGCSWAIKKNNPNATIILADPPGSALIGAVNCGVLFTTADKEGHRKRVVDDTVIEGVGLNRLTANFRAALNWIDKGYTIEDIEAVRVSRYLLRKEGIFCGSSSAMNIAAVVKGVRDGTISKGDVVVTILCDSGMRHLSKFYSQEYLDKRKGRQPELHGELGSAALEDNENIFKCVF